NVTGPLKENAIADGVRGGIAPRSAKSDRRTLRAGGAGGSSRAGCSSYADRPLRTDGTDRTLYASCAAYALRTWRTDCALRTLRTEQSNIESRATGGFLVFLAIEKNVSGSGGCGSDERDAMIRSRRCDPSLNE